MALTAEQMEARAGKITASRAHVLMDGNDEQLYDLWRELVGDPTYEQPDFSGVWPVQLGNATEALNLEWYERNTGRKVSRQGEVVVSLERPWAACTLDAFDEEINAVIEAKHVGGWEPLHVILARYYCQVQWQMYVTDAELAIFSIIEGARAPQLEPIDPDYEYREEMLARADRFIESVELMVPPVQLPEKTAPMADIEEIDMTKTEHGLEWRTAASAWIETRDPAALFKKTVDGLKKMVPETAQRAYGGGVEVRRAKNGSLRIYPERKAA